MLKSVRVVSANSSYKNLKLALGYSDALPLYIRSISGLNPPTATINTADSVAKEGSNYSSSRTNNRNIVIELGCRKVPGANSLELIRNKVYENFPLGGIVRIEFITDYLEKPVFIEGYVENNEISIFSKDPIHFISIICPNPNFVESGYTVIQSSGNLTTLNHQIGTAESPFILEKTFDKETGVFSIVAGNSDGLLLKGLPAGSVLRVNTEPDSRKVVLVTNGVEKPAYKYVIGGTMALRVSQANPLIAIGQDDRSTTGFEVKLKKAYIGL